jgi:hypothetical protein
MPKRDLRRHQRIPFLGPLHIAWEEDYGSPKYARGKCLDVSEGGLRIEVEVFEPIPVRSRVSLRADRINLHASGTVKHAARRGSTYIVGLELSQALSEQALAVIRDAP